MSAGDDFWNNAGGPTPAAPSAPAAPAPGGGGVTVPEVRYRGADILMPGVPQKQTVVKDQDAAKLVEQLQYLNAQYKHAVNMDVEQRNPGTPLDEAIQKEMKKSLMGRVGETASNAGDEFMLALGPGSSRPAQIVPFAAFYRGQARALSLAASHLRSYQSVKDISEHYPYAWDSAKNSYDKIAFWDMMLKEMRRELAERGTIVPPVTSVKDLDIPDEYAGVRNSLAVGEETMPETAPAPKATATPTIVRASPVGKYKVGFDAKGKRFVMKPGSTDWNPY